MVLAGSWDGSFACRLGSECCLPNNRVAGSAPAYRIDSRRPRPTDRTPVTGNADRSWKSVAGQRVSPVIPSARLSNAPGVSDLSRWVGWLLAVIFFFLLLLFLLLSLFFFFSFFFSFWKLGVSDGGRLLGLFCFVFFSPSFESQVCPNFHGGGLLSSLFSFIHFFFIVRPSMEGERLLAFSFLWNKGTEHIEQEIIWNTPRANVYFPCPNKQKDTQPIIQKGMKWIWN